MPREQLTEKTTQSGFDYRQMLGVRPARQIAVELARVGTYACRTHSSVLELSLFNGLGRSTFASPPRPRKYRKDANDFLGVGPSLFKWRRLSLSVDKVLHLK